MKEILNAFKPHVYGHWIVQNGMGTPTLDYIGCCCSDYFAIETKAEGKKLTPQQNLTKERTEEANGAVFCIIGHDELVLAEFEAWLHERVMRKLSRRSGRHNVHR